MGIIKQSMKTVSIGYAFNKPLTESTLKRLGRLGFYYWNWPIENPQCTWIFWDNLHLNRQGYSGFKEFPNAT